MVAVAKPPFTTPQEYLYWERKSETKHEYLNGIVVAMAGASWEHGLITGNSQGELYAQLKETPCATVPQDLRVRVAECNRYYYPDVVVVCGEPEFEDETFDTLLNPVVIIEILSETTAAHDRGEKWNCYQTIPSLTTYVLIAQDRAQVEVYRRQENGWFYTSTQGLEASVTFEALDVTLRLADLYARVTFPPPTTEVNVDDERAHRA